jgi:regulatory protein YycH of two-component signal transduction system YycFG
MKTFLFTTSATMKHYNHKKWWIDSGIIRDITIKADNITSALEQYRETVINKYYIDISKSALKNKSAMYIDTPSGEPKQCGYVITASTEFDNDHRGWVKQYIDLWVNVSIITSPFEEV